MAKILLTSHVDTEEPGSSLARLHHGIQQALGPEHPLVLMPADLGGDRRFDQWLRAEAWDCELALTSTPQLINRMRALGWPGRFLVNALGSFPRGAVTVRHSLPFLRACDRIWCSCTADRRIYEDLVAHDGAQPEAVVLPLGVDAEIFTPPSDTARAALRREWGIQPDELALVYAGRITREKNVHAILEAVHALNSRGRKVKLLVSGSVQDVPFRALRLYRSDLRENIQELIRTLGLAGRVVILPWRGDRELNALLQAADVFINLTLHHDENFGLAQVEAMSAGLPVVATCWGGLMDTVADGETGFLAGTWITDNGVRYDMPRVIGAVTALMDSEELRQRMGEAARERVLRRYAWPVVARGLLDLVERMRRAPSGERPVSLTDFGRRYHARFSAPSPHEPGTTDALAPVYAGFADPDYRRLIAPYTSRAGGGEAAGRWLFAALPGSCERGYFWSRDLLHLIRVQVNEPEATALALLSRYEATDRERLPASGDVVAALVRKGLAGYSVPVQATRARVVAR